MTSVLQLRADYESGRMSRSAYWLEMQARHRQVADYAALLHDSEIERIEIRAAGLQVVLKNGLRLHWRPDDLRSAPSVLINNGQYEQEERRLLERFARDHHDILDIGANVGWYSLHMARQAAQRGGVVYAVEAIPTTFQLLLANLAINPETAAHIHPLHLALGERDGMAQFFIPRVTGHVAASRQVLMPDEANDQVEVKLQRLDEMVREYGIESVGLIKCDVEGSEWLVIQGGMETLRGQRPVLMLELLRKWSARFGYHPNQVIQALTELGYQCWSCAGGQFQAHSHIDDSTSATNFFFLHRESHCSIAADWERGMSLEAWLQT